MDIFNQTPFEFGLLNGRLKFPAHSVSFMVKATIALRKNGGTCTADEQLPVTGTQYFDDDAGQLGGPKFDTDFAYFKPKSDVCVVANCHTPNAKPLPHCPVLVSVGETSAQLMVYGDRFWQKKVLGMEVTDPEPFTEIPLRYENSFGGVGYLRNPAGKGVAAITVGDGSSVWPLPNIESIDEHIVSNDQKPAPAGFACLNSEWSDRKDRLGSYDKHWLENRWPWFPEDFNSNYFNSAPPSLQVDGYLQGDELVRCVNMHPDIADYKTTLPGIRARCFTRAESSSEGKSFQEIPLRLDTLTIDMVDGQLVLLWRGWTSVESEKMEEIKSVLILAEAMDQPAKSAEECYAILKQCELEEAQRYAPETEVALASDENPEKNALSKLPEFAAATMPSAAELLGDPATTLQQKRDFLASRGMDTDLAKNTSAEEKAMLEGILERIERLDGMLEEEIKADIDQTKLAALTKAGVDPVSLPELSEAEQQLSEKFEKQIAAIDSEAGAGETAEALPPTTRAEIDQIVAEHGSLAQVDLSLLPLADIDFSGAKLMQADFSKRDLSGVNFASADLTGALFIACDLTKCNFGEACLRDADLTEATLLEANFQNATLDNALFEACDARATNFEQIKAVGSNFAKAVLQGAVFKDALLTRANFEEADISHVSFRNAKLDNASLDKAVAEAALFINADMTGLRASDNNNFRFANFTQAQMEGANLEGAQCANANFSYVDMHDINFSEADLTNASLHCADLRFGKLVSALMKNTVVTEANLFEASLEKAKLTNTDFSRANLYGAELLDVEIADAIFDGANLRMTKLQQRLKK